VAYGSGKPKAAMFLQEDREAADFQILYFVTQLGTTP
jgi:hypothetical protein